MTDETPTPEQVEAACVANSKQLNAVDLISGPVTVTITKVRQNNDKNQPWSIYLEGYDGRPWKPCKNMRRIIKAVLTDEAKTWPGNRLTLYCDPTVVYAGNTVSGIRISHMTGLENEKPRTFSLTFVRNKPVEVTIKPIAEMSAEDQKFVSEASRELSEADSLEMLRTHGDALKNKSKAIQDALRPLYAKRQKELEAQSTKV